MSETSEIDHIYRDGRHYDQLFKGAHVDYAFWRDLASQQDGPVLELGCGTGRLAIPLAQEGFRVTGLDRSKAMLREARNKARAAAVTVEWVEGDMRDFDLGNRFPLTLLPNNTLGHLLSLDDFEACVASVKRHLAPGGLFVIDVFVPKMALLLEKPGERFPFSEYDDPDGRGKIVVTESYVYEPHTQIKRITTHHAIPGEAEEVRGELNIRMYFPQELDALLQYNGLTMIAKYGNYEREAFDARSEKQLIICSAERDVA